MAYDEVLADRIRAVLIDRTDVEEKSMFGDITFMVGDQMCCGVLKDDLVVKVGPDGFDALDAWVQRGLDFVAKHPKETSKRQRSR